MNLEILEELDKDTKITQIFNKYTCAYCGESATDRDHIIPRSISNFNPKSASTNKSNTIPSCKQCNVSLGNRFIITISERAEFLIQLYNKKFKNLLSMPHHTKEDIKELEGSLKKMVRSQMNKKKIILDRLNNLELIVLLEPSIKDIWEVIDRKGEYE